MKKVFKYLFLALLGFILIVLLYLLLPGLWNRWFVYPDFQDEVNAFQQLRKEPPALTSLRTYRGVLHAHSYWSHDSEGTLARILPAAKKADLDFIFLTDHPRHNADTFPRGYKGHYEGVLIEPGSEKHGYCAWPLDSTVIDWTLNRDSLIKHIVEDGGLFFYAHSEEDHQWGNPWYQGMEVYNIHTDTKDESLIPLIFNVIVNGSKYRDWAMRELFDEQTAILALWDSLNHHRKIVGFSAVDAHDNQNLRARYLEDGRVEWVGPNADPIDTVEVNFLNSWLFTAPDDEGWIFKLMIDTYETSFGYVTNYVVSDTLSVSSLADHIRKGNLFIAFKSLGDAQGFMFSARDDAQQVVAILGDSISGDQAKSFYAVSPLPGQFRLIKDGEVIDTSGDATYEYRWMDGITNGAYRIEVHIKLNEESVPWVYTNPIYVY